MKRKRVSTIRVKEATTSVRLFPDDRRTLIAAATEEGVSICEFLRRAMRERSQRFITGSAETNPVRDLASNG